MPWIWTSTEAAVHFVLLCDISGFYNKIRTSAMEVEVFCVTIFDIIQFYVHTSEHRKVAKLPVIFFISFLFFGRRQSCQHPENTTKWNSAWVTHDGVIKWKYFETLSRLLWRQCNDKIHIDKSIHELRSCRICFPYAKNALLYAFAHHVPGFYNTLHREISWYLHAIVWSWGLQLLWQI